MNDGFDCFTLQNTRTSDLREITASPFWTFAFRPTPKRYFGQFTVASFAELLCAIRGKGFGCARKIFTAKIAKNGRKDRRDKLTCEVPLRSGLRPHRWPVLPPCRLPPR